MEQVVPRYGSGALADVVPSLLAGFGVPGTVDVLGIAGAPRVCLLLVDGLGWELLLRHRDAAPFLASLADTSEPVTAGFPATTATSVAALGTGLPPGEHGFVGFSFAVDGELLNTLLWHRHGVPEQVDLLKVVVPERMQPVPTAFERARDAGVAVRLVVPRHFEGSGLTRAVMRGGEFRPQHALGDLVSHTLDALRQRERLLCYSYHADLDAMGHVYGPGTEPWRRQLTFVDQLASAIAADLPPDARLVVTADHGMVTVTEDDRVDFDVEPTLRAGVRALAGEPRVRHVYTEPGATADVRAAWTELLGDRAWTLTRAEAVAAGWFGPTVAAHVRPRIGDLVVAARGSTAVTRSTVEPFMTRLVGQHGSLTEDEQLVPLLVVD